MKLTPRPFLHLAAGAAALLVVSLLAGAQTYPSRPLSLIVFVPAGGTPDIIARLIGQSISQRLASPWSSTTDPAAAGGIHAS